MQLIDRDFPIIMYHGTWNDMGRGLVVHDLLDQYLSSNGT